jgi:hypothetical protein
MGKAFGSEFDKCEPGEDDDPHADSRTADASSSDEAMIPTVRPS